MKKYPIALLTLSLATFAFAGSGREDTTARLQSAGSVLTEIMAAPDKGIPKEVLNGAKCIAVVPAVAKGGFVFGGEHRGGVVTCRTAQGWSAPVFISIGGGNFGFQSGAQSADLVILFMNDNGVQALLSDKFELGADASAAAGPVGRHASAGTDWKLNTGALTYSRTKGVFSGVAVDGGKIQEDNDSMVATYGKNVSFRKALSGEVHAPASTDSFLAAVNAVTNPVFQVVRIFYATDRQQQNLSSGVAYSSERAANGSVRFGTALISIPRDHRMGELEGASLFRLEFRNNPEKHVTLLRVTAQSQDNFLQEIRDRVATDPSKEVLIFVHGYNVTFEDAARRRGQMTYDLGFSGAPILYSWPSKASYFGYAADEATVEWSIPHFKSFLEYVAQRSGASVIHIVAHSMGSRLLIDTLNVLAAEQKTLKPKLQQVILAAPDIDSGVFMQMVTALSRTGSHFTIYESSTDHALQASHMLHDFARLGDSRPTVQIVEPFDTIDATNVDTEMLGHSYFADNKSILGDVFYVIRGRPPQERFGIERKTLGGEAYWKVKP